MAASFSLATMQGNRVYLLTARNTREANRIVREYAAALVRMDLVPGWGVGAIPPARGRTGYRIYAVRHVGESTGGETARQAATAP